MLSLSFFLFPSLWPAKDRLTFMIIHIIFVNILTKCTYIAQNIFLLRHNLTLRILLRQCNVIRSRQLKYDTWLKIIVLYENSFINNPSSIRISINRNYRAYLCMRIFIQDRQEQIYCSIIYHFLSRGDHKCNHFRETDNYNKDI